MAFDFKAATPGSAPASSLLFGADSQLAANPSVYTSTGSGSVVLSVSATLVTPLLGTPTSGILTNCTGLPISTGVSGLGTGVVTAIGNAVNTNGGLVTASTASIASGAILTGSGSGTAISAITPGVGIATWLATPSSANLAAAVTDETGTGPLVFANSPTFTDDITLGTQQTTQGAIILANTAAGAYATTIKSSNSATAAWTLTLPTTAGTNNYVLKTDGSGNTSWVAQSGGGGSPGGTSGQYQYNDSGSFGGIGLILFADTTFYVRTDGNNANDGLSNTSGGAWATIQYACDYMKGVDANGYGVTIQVGDGSYACASPGNQCVSILYRPRNALYFKIYGNTTTPANVVIDGVDRSPYGFLVGQNYATNARQPCIVDELGGFTIKNAYSFAAVYAWSKLRIIASISEANHEGLEIAEYSNVSYAELLFKGDTGVLVYGSNAVLGAFWATFDTGATLSGTGYQVYSYAAIDVSGADYTHLSAAGGAVQWFVDAFGYLNTGGKSASIPGSAGSTDSLGKVA